MKGKILFAVVLGILFLGVVSSQYYSSTYPSNFNSGYNTFSNSYSISNYQNYQPGVSNNYQYGNNLYNNPYYSGNNYNSVSSGYNNNLYQQRQNYYNSYANQYPTSSYGAYPSSSSGYGRYYEPFPSQNYLQSQGIDLYGNFGEDQCNSGTDFLVQVAPFGCSPAVVRSDLLEEQNVPVFCQLAATQLNPLIDVEAIYSMDFTSQGGYPEEVVGIGFHPANAALSRSATSSYGITGRTGSLLNSPILNNIGYAVIVLKQQENEASMPDEVSGNLTAVLRYDLKNAFGIGNVEFALPQVSDSQWGEDYVRYSFWEGKGFLRADVVEPDRATVSIFSGENVIVDTVNLGVGESREVSLPGFYCLAKADLKLDKIGIPDTTARFRINNDYVDLVAGQRFLDDRCTVQYVEKQGLFEFAQVRCSEDVGSRVYDFSKSPGIVLNIDGSEQVYKVGEPLPVNNGNQVYHVRIVDENPETGKMSVLFEASSLGLNYRQYRSTLASSNSYIYNDNQRIDLLDAPKSLPGSNSNVQFVGLVEGVNQDFSSYIDSSPNVANLNSEFKSYYDNAIQDYERVVSDYGSEPMPVPQQDTTFGKEALTKAASLSRQTGQVLTGKEFIDRANEQYGNDVNLLVEDPTFYSEQETRVVSVNGRSEVITFMGANKPSLNDFGATVYVRDERTNDVQSRTLGKDDRFVISKDESSSKDQIILRYVDEVSIDLDYTGNDDFNRGGTRRLTVFRDQPLRIGNYTFSVEDIRLNKVAYVRLVPKIEDVRSEANFSYNIGIEKRAIELSPEKTKERINKANETLETLSKIEDNLGKVVKTGKAACLATSGFLLTKNLLENLDGKQIARQKVMRSQGGWTEFCRQEVSKSGSRYSSLDDCFNENAPEIDADVEMLHAFMEQQNEEIKNFKDATSSDGVFGNEYYNEEEYLKQYLLHVQEDVEGCNIVNPNSPSQTIAAGDLIESLSPENERQGGFNVEQARDIQLYCKMLRSGEISSDSVLYKSLSTNLYDTSKNVRETTQDLILAESTQGSFTQGGYENVRVNVYGDKRAVSGAYSGALVQGNKVVGANLDASETYAFEPVYVGNEKYLLILNNAGGSSYNIDKAFKLNSVDANGNIQVSDIPSGSAYDESKLKTFFGKGFTKFDASTYRNEYKDAEAKFYESEPYKGFPAVVPFDLNNGWYAATKQSVAAFGNLGAYDDSGRVSSFWLCNVGSNGLEEFDTGFGDDHCQQINVGTGTTYADVLGLNDGDSRRLISRALSAIESAANQRQRNNNLRSIVIEGQTIKVGEPAVNVPNMQCQDFMSPTDCNVMFNVCDPVICPSSRCNLGGNYNVDNVIQSGIVGSVALCLPNYQEGIAVPICLSGVHAGVQGLESIYQNYYSCLQESLETGQQVGICDEIHSIYMCDFLWQQAAPIAKIGAPKLLGSLLGEGTRGGGEYLGAQSAFDAAESSVDYFTQSYAVNSFEAFKARSTDEVGTAVCKSFASVTFPDVIDNLIEPDSPNQYTAQFEEIPYTSATVPPTSQYKVFYHIFSGKDIGSSYSVYFRPSDGTSFFQSSGRYVVASGYIERGGFASETKEFTAPSGLTELCVSVNANEDCGFGKVTTSFALNYLNNLYLTEQASTTNINSESTCVSGSPSVYSLANTNLQAGANEVLNPQLYNYGIVRVCATDNPASNLDPTSGTDAARWQSVGTCDNGIGNVKCWVDTRSVKENIDVVNLENAALGEINSNYRQFLEGQEGFVDEAGAKNLIDEIFRGKLSDSEVVNQVSSVLDKVVFAQQKAQLLLLRGNAYGNLARKSHSGLISQVDSSNQNTEDLSDPSGWTFDGSAGVVTGDGANVIRPWTYDAAIARVDSLGGSSVYTNNKDLIKEFYDDKLLTASQVDDIDGGLFNLGQKDFFYIRDILVKNKAEADLDAKQNQAEQAAAERAAALNGKITNLNLIVDKDGGVSINLEHSCNYVKFIFFENSGLVILFESDKITQGSFTQKLLTVESEGDYFIQANCYINDKVVDTSKTSTIHYP